MELGSRSSAYTFGRLYLVSRGTPRSFEVLALAFKVFVGTSLGVDGLYTPPQTLVIGSGRIVLEQNRVHEQYQQRMPPFTLQNCSFDPNF